MFWELTNDQVLRDLQSNGNRDVFPLVNAKIEELHNALIKLWKAWYVLGIVNHYNDTKTTYASPEPYSPEYIKIWDIDTYMTDLINKLQPDIENSIAADSENVVITTPDLIKRIETYLANVIDKTGFELNPESNSTLEHFEKIIALRNVLRGKKVHHPFITEEYISNSMKKIREMIKAEKVNQVHF